VKGHNGKCLCRLCLIMGLLIKTGRVATYYVPHKRTHPQLAMPGQPEPDPAALPMRTEENFLLHARAAQFALTQTQANDFAKQTSIKGVSILSYLPSISMPQSFPYDFMHLMLENVMKNLFAFWTGKFKDLDEGTGHYVIDKKVWKEIGAATAASGSSIPGQFGARPPDFSETQQAMTADTWLFWLLYLGPVLLENCFPDVAYYKHFLDFSDIVRSCIQFALEAAEIEEIRNKCIKWVKKYEE
ncbi:hypothetical protein FISHEDRAFT_35276, partial [Fistulina hepatica ATCC 64428]